MHLEYANYLKQFNSKRSLTTNNWMFLEFNVIKEEFLGKSLTLQTELQ